MIKILIFSIKFWNANLLEDITLRLSNPLHFLTIITFISTMCMMFFPIKNTGFFSNVRLIGNIEYLLLLIRVPLCTCFVYKIQGSILLRIRKVPLTFPEKKMSKYPLCIQTRKNKVEELKTGYLWYVPLMLRTNEETKKIPSPKFFFLPFVYANFQCRR